VAGLGATSIIITNESYGRRRISGRLAELKEIKELGRELKGEMMN